MHCACFYGGRSLGLWNQNLSYRGMTGGGKVQYNAWEELIAQVNSKKRNFSLRDVQSFEQINFICIPLLLLTQHQSSLCSYRMEIVVVSIEHLNSLAYFGPPQPKRVVFLHDNHHLDLIESLPRFLHRRYSCYVCNKGHNDSCYIG